MSSTTVRYRSAEFAAYDLLIEIWMLEVADQIGDGDGVEPWLNELRDEWNLQATSGFGFGPCPALDTFLTTDERRQRLAAYFRKALKSLSERSSVITPDELTKAKVGGNEVFYTEEVPTQLAIDVGNEFITLLS